MALHGRDVLRHFRERLLDDGLERDLRLSLHSPVNLLRLAAGGVDERSNLAATLDTDVFRGATFADLYRRNTPDVWINATDLTGRCSWTARRASTSARRCDDVVFHVGTVSAESLPPERAPAR